MAEQATTARVQELEASADLIGRLRERAFKAPDEATIDLGPLIGIWDNCDASTRGVVRVELTDKGGTLLVQVFGACVPTPCDWGQVEGIAYAASVVDNEAIAFTAFFDPGFAEEIVAGHLDGGTLVLEVFDRFKDGSGRSNYYLREYLCRRRG